MPRCWQIQQHAGPRASSWQHRCPADPRNAAPFPPSSPGDMAGRGGGNVAGRALLLSLDGRAGRGACWWAARDGRRTFPPPWVCLHHLL